MMFARNPDRETLNRIKRWPSLINRFELVKIYSAEHGYYWRGSGQGYTSNPDESNTMPIKDAYELTKHCGKEKRIEFVATPHETARPNEQED